MKRIIISIIVFLLGATATTAQNIELEPFLDKAYKTTVHYRETFKNLVAEEVRTLHYYRKDDSPEETRTIKSQFLVYQSAKDNSSIEYRNVMEFNGKDVARDEKDIVKLFEKLGKAASSIEELGRLRQEGNRFDGKSQAYGLTLWQAMPLQPFYRPFFSFAIIGHEKIEGRDVVIVEYKQSKPTLRIKVNATPEEWKQEPSGMNFDTFLPNHFRPTNPRLQGKLWLDTETAQLWRNEFEVTIQPALLSKPVVSANFKYEYQSSEFGILVPKKLWLLSYRFAGKTEADLVRTRGSEKTFAYSKFAQPASEIKDVKITKP